MFRALIAVAGLFALSAVLAALTPTCQLRKDSECRYNLRAWYLAQSLTRAETGEYATDAADLALTLEHGNRYLYAWRPFGQFARDRALRGMAGILPDREPVPQRAIPTIVTGGLRVGVFGRCPDCAATAVCVGQLDDDAQYDVWSVSTEPRLDWNGELIAPGVPYHEQSEFE